MLSLRKWIPVACVLALASAAWGQVTVRMGVQAAPPPKASPILEALPGGSLGFVVVPNVGKTLSAVDQYLKDIGVADLLPIAGDLLTTLKAAAQLGDGFNPDGGFGAVVLDPMPYGIDLPKMMREGGPPAGAEKPKFPVVVFVPASGLKEAFGKYEMSAEGDLTKVQFRMGEMYAAMKGSYAVVSPNAKAVRDVLAAKTTAAADLSKDLLEAIVSSDVAVHANLKTAGPLLQAFMQMVMAEAKAAPKAGMPFAPEQFLSLWAKAMEQLHGITLTLQVGKTGLVLQERVAFDPAGAIGKAMAAVQPGGSAGLDRLPNLPYVLAVGSLAGGAQGGGDKEMMDLLLKALPGLKDETRSKIEKLSQHAQDQVTASQFVLGGAPQGAGLFGLAMVLSCKDANQFKATLAEVADTVTDLVRDLIPSPDAAGLKITYVKEAEKLDSLSVDAVEVQHPQLAKMSEDDKAGMSWAAGMQKVLGEAKIRLLVAAADDKTLVLTFGGGTAMLAETMKVAKGGGSIPKDAGVMEAMKSLPKEPRVMVMLDAAHLLAVVQNAVESMGGSLPPIQLTCKTPLAIGAGAVGTTAQAVVFIPNDLVKDAVGLVKTWLVPAERRGATTRPARGGESF